MSDHQIVLNLSLFFEKSDLQSYSYLYNCSYKKVCMRLFFAPINAKLYSEKRAISTIPTLSTNMAPKHKIKKSCRHY